MRFSIHVRTLRMAAERLGGIEGLRDYLKVPMFPLRAWLRAEVEVPDAIFLKCVDLILDDQIATKHMQGQPSKQSASPTLDPDATNPG